MIDLELQLLEDNPNGLRVLIAYQKATEALIEEEKATLLAQEKANAEALSQTPEHEVEQHQNSLDEESADINAIGEDEDADDAKSSGPPKRRAATWLTRITAVEGVDSQELSKIHGQFIAYGLLKCDLADRSSGMVYQLTSTAKQVLAKMASRVPNADVGEEDVRDADIRDADIRDDDVGQSAAA